MKASVFFLALFLSACASAPNQPTLPGFAIHYECEERIEEVSPFTIRASGEIDARLLSEEWMNRGIREKGDIHLFSVEEFNRMVREEGVSNAPLQTYEKGSYTMVVSIPNRENKRLAQLRKNGQPCGVWYVHSRPSH